MWDKWEREKARLSRAVRRGIALGLALAGAGLLSAFLTGSAGAWGFALCMLLSGFATVRIMGRRA